MTVLQIQHDSVKHALKDRTYYCVGVLQVNRNDICLSIFPGFFRVFHPHVSMEDRVSMAQNWTCSFANVLWKSKYFLILTTDVTSVSIQKSLISCLVS